MVQRVGTAMQDSHTERSSVQFLKKLGDRKQNFGVIQIQKCGLRENGHFS